MKVIGKFAEYQILVLLAGILFISTPSPVGAEVGMVTGSKVGTYIKFGQAIAEQVKEEGLDIQVKESEGSIANIRRMNSHENAALGIVQSDVLGFLSRSENVELKKVAQRIRMIFPFYNEEVHLFANRDIHSIKDLAGKRVIIGKEGSGNWLTATNLMKIAGVQPAERLNYSPEDGVLAILQGKADAIFYVAGKPVKLFTSLGKLKEQEKFAPLFDNVHFVSITDPAILREYETSEIGPEDYPWVSEGVPTAAVKAILVSFDFSSKKTPYYQQRCQELGIIGRVIRNNIGTLRENGHPKWKEVDLEADVGIWKLDTCSRSALTKPVEDDLEQALLRELQR